MRRRPVSAATIGWSIVGTAVLSAVIRWIGVRNGATFDFVGLWLASAAVVAAVLLVRALRADDPPVTGFRLPTSSEAPPRPFADVARWEERMSWSTSDADRFAMSVHSRIVDLVATRLRLRHDVDMDARPERAAELLDPTLRAFLAAPPATPPDPSVMADIVRRIEEL